MNELFELAKANQDTYLAAYQVGYDEGFKAGMVRAVEIMEKSFAKPIEPVTP